MSELVIGLHSGPSADGVDAALAEVADDRPARVRASFHLPYEAPVRKVLGEATLGAPRTMTELANLDVEVTHAFAQAAAALAEHARIDLARVACVGFSGQELSRVAPRQDRQGGCLAVGSGAALARRLGVMVYGSFTECDLAAGGWGMPAARAQTVLFRDERLSRVVVNLGGLATLTFVPAAAALSDVQSFHVGPGTVLLDWLAGRLVARPFDADGQLASQGAANGPLLNELMAHPFFHQGPPRATSLAEWGAIHGERVLRMAEKHSCRVDRDILATATELTAQTVSRAALSLTERPHQVILSGGGALNIDLASRIRRHLSPCSTVSSEKFDIPVRAEQAFCLAVLAHEHAAGRLPSALRVAYGS